MHRLNPRGICGYQIQYTLCVLVILPVSNDEFHLVFVREVVQVIQVVLFLLTA